MVSFFGRLFYGYDNRYLVTVNFRADGSSKFPQNPWGYFPSVSLAWRMSEESWLKDHSDILDMLKIRAGWGQLGNQSIDQDNFTMNFGNHQITVGTQSDYRSFKNGFAQDYPGSWVFSSIDDFKFNVLAAKDYLSQHGNMSGFDITDYNPAQFGLTGVVNGGLPNSAGTGQASLKQKYSLMDGFPYAEIDVLQLGFYVQDKWTPSQRFALTYGLRVDMPIFMTDLPENPRVAAETYRDGIRIDVSKYPGVHPQFSPRVGFNWKPLEDGSLQLRGVALPDGVKDEVILLVGERRGL